MADKWPLANGNWSNAANWNGGTKPVAGDDVFADGRTVTVDENFTVATLRTTQRSGGTIGGTFDFNTGGITATVTNVTTSIVQGSATTPLTISASSGTITIVLSSQLVTATTSADIMTYSGNCNLNITAPTFSGIQGSGVNNRYTINKTSSGTITINGNIVSGNNNGGAGTNCLQSTAGNTIINGNVSGFGSGNTGPNYGINQNAGTLIVNGNVTGGGGVANANQGILFSGTSITINGVVTGGASAVAINTASPINNITGNVTGGTVAAITSSSANQIQVTGTVTASASAPAISMTNTNGQVYLNGNMVNNNGKMAIFAPIVWLNKNNTTSAAFFTSGGVARTLYSADTVPNTPAVNNVREGVVFGAGNSLTGTIEMPVAADVRNGVVYDNGTTGTALFTTSQLLTEINASSDAVAVRMKNAATPQILGELMEAFKK